MSISQEIRVRVEGGVLTITFNRLERNNPVAAVMCGEVTAVCGPPAYLAKRKRDFSIS